MPPTEVNAQAVIDRLLRRIARLEYDLAVAQVALDDATAETESGDE